MNNVHSDLLRDFFTAANKLSSVGIIHSRNYVDDICRYLCSQVYGMKLEDSRLDLSYDGIIDDLKIRTVFNNCPVGHKVILTEPFEFDELIVLLGPNCSLRPEGVSGDIIFYRFTPDNIRLKFDYKDGQYIGGIEAFSRDYDRVFSFN